MCYNGGNPYVNMFCFDHEFEGKVNKMAKKDHLRWNKKEAVSDEVIDIAEVEVETNNEPDEIETRKREEREKCEAMSNDELIDYTLQTLENLWSSHEQREKLAESIRPLEDKVKEQSIQISDDEKDKKELIDKITELREKIGKLERKAALVDGLEEQVSDLQGEIKDKDDAMDTMKVNYGSSVEKLESELAATKTENATLQEENENFLNTINHLNDELDVAVRANFAGLNIRSITGDMEQRLSDVRKKHEKVLMQDVKKMVEDMFSASTDAIAAADDSIKGQEEAAKALEAAEEELKKRKTISELNEYSVEEAEKAVEAARRNYEKVQSKQK